MAISENSKARAYDTVHPGTDLPVEQRAERYDRMNVKSKYEGLSRKKGRAVVGSIIVPNSNCWCKCGMFINHEGDCR